MNYKDLSDSAKECAYKGFQEYSGKEGFDFQVEDILEDYRDMLETKGIYDPVFNYSGFHSQGDGACFTCSIDLKDFLDAHPEVRNNHRELYIAVISFDGDEPVCSYYGIHITKIVGHSSYSHEKTVHLGNWNLEVHPVHDLVGGEDYEKLFVNAEEDIEETCRDYMRQLYRELEEAYEYSTSLNTFLGISEFQDFDENGELT